MNRGVRRERILAADGTRLALYRLGPPDASPVLMMPGTFSNHTFWLGTRGHGLAWSVARAGFQAVVLDPRGHGASEHAAGRRSVFEHWGRLDVPAAVAAIAADHPRVLLVGHSAGGAAMVMALAGEPEVRERVAGVVVLATPVPWLQRWGRFGARGLRFTSRLLGRFPARLVGLGPEDEQPGVMAQWMTWYLRRQWIGEEGLDYVARLAEVPTPVLGISGAGDSVFAPPVACRALVEMLGSGDRSYRLAGRETGFAEDFDHVSIVVGAAAQDQVWPIIIGWLRDHSPPVPRGLHAR